MGPLLSAVASGGGQAVEIATESESVSHDEGISMPYEDRSNIRQVSVRATDQIGQSLIIYLCLVEPGPIIFWDR